MQYGKIEGLDKKISRLVQGAIHTDDKKEKESFLLLDEAMAAGINTFDSAHVYGGGASERGLGNWMQARGNREDVVIITKCSHHNADRKRVTPYDILADCHDSLARLNSDYIDLYFLHRDNLDVAVGPIVETMNKLKDEGKIHAFGGSNWTHQRVQEANDYAAEKGLTPFTLSSPNFSLAAQIENPWGPGCVTIGGSESEARDWYQKTSMPVFAYSSLAGGLLSGRMTRENWRETATPPCATAYCHEPNFERLDRATELAEKKGASVPQIALAWVLSYPLEVFPLIAPTNRQEIQDCVAALRIQLTDDEVRWLENGE